MRVNVAIVAHENPKIMLLAAIESVLREEELIDTLYLVDNSPTDRLRKNFESRAVYIHSGKNLGFGAARAGGVYGQSS